MRQFLQLFVNNILYISVLDIFHIFAGSLKQTTFEDGKC